MIKRHRKAECIRFMTYRTYRYTACYDTVGYHIIVPESQEYIALNPKIWPADITCRYWKNPGIWYRDKQAEQLKMAWVNNILVLILIV